MSGGLRVLAPGLHTTVQDFGRFGAQALGVPVSGALDRDLLRIANALVGNAPDEAALEVLHAGPVLEITAPALRVALAAYGGAMLLDEAEDRRVPAWRSVTLPRGTRLRVVAGRDTAAGYLAIGGGISVAPVAGSRSTYVRGGFGGWHGRALAEGDDIPARHDGRSGRTGAAAVGAAVAAARSVAGRARAAGRPFHRGGDRDAVRGGLRGHAGGRPHGAAAGRAGAGASRRARHRLGRHRRGRVAGAGQRAPGAAAGRSADHRRLSQDRRRLHRRPAARGAVAAGRPGALRRDRRGGGAGGAAGARGGAGGADRRHRADRGPARHGDAAPDRPDQRRRRGFG